MCNQCNSPSPCSCPSLEICECDVKTLVTCLQYTKATLPITGIVAGDDGDTILEKIEAALKAISDKVDEALGNLPTGLNCNLLEE